MSGALWDDVVDLDAPALVTVDDAVPWRSLLEIAASTSMATRGRVGLVGDTGIDAVVGVFAALHHGATPVLGHPRWPTRLRQDAFTRAGVGRALSSSQQAILDVEGDHDDAGTVVFTSGSSGLPRPVLHTWRAWRAGAAGAAERMPFGPGDRWLLSLPICHVGGLALVARALHRGGAIAVPSPGQPLVDAIVALRPSHISLVAAQLRTVLSSAAATAIVARARVVLVGGGPTPPALFEEALTRGLPVRQTWGLTEMGSQVCTSTAGHPETCGAPLPGRAVRVADDGELVVSGAGRCAGVIDGDGVTVPFDVDGGYATGDLGRFVGGADGGLVIVGRKDFRFISGGENIQPEAVAAALADARLSVFIVPVDDDRFGQRPFCFFDGAVADDTDDVVAIRTLRARADERLPRFMHPVGYARLPTSTGLKPRRADLIAAANALQAATALRATTP